MQSPKTHAQEIRTIERKGDLPTQGQAPEPTTGPEQRPTHPEARQSEMPVSQGGMNQESHHNKHNKPPVGG